MFASVRKMGAFVLTLLAIFATSTIASAATEGDCDRQCLKKMADLYFVALGKIRQNAALFTAPSERVPRLAMLAAAHQYFEGMEQNTDNVVPFDESCNRTENGVQTTNDAGPRPPDAGNGYPAPNLGALGCKAQFNAGGVNIFSTPERRFWMVDEERGIVLGLFVFTIMDAHAVLPIAEALKIKNGRLYGSSRTGNI
jgi:hypothetical protein